MLRNLFRNKWLYIALAAVFAVGLLFVLIYVVNWGLSDTKITDLYKEGTFIDGIYLNNINLSGKTMEEGREIAIGEATRMLKSSSVRVKIGDRVYTLKGSEIGALVDYESVLKEAMLTGRRGSRLANSREVKDVAENGRYFFLNMDVDISVLESTLKEMSATFNTLPQDSMVAVRTSRTPSTYYINSTVEISDSIVGRTVDIEGLMNSIIKAIRNGDQNRIIVPDAEETLPENINLEELEEQTTLISSTSQSLEGLDSSQIFNIWKGSEMLTNIVLQPGDSLSLLELFGDMEKEGNWKYGLIMTDKGYQQIMGGGIEYLASVFYQNSLSVGLTVDEVYHHVVVPKNIVDGLDAMIYRAEGKDLKVTNNFKFPVRIIANCDGGKKKNLEVLFYGGEPNYKFEVSTHMTKEIEPSSQPEEIVDETKAQGYEEWVEERRNGKVIEVYRQRRDSESGDLIGGQMLVETVTYPEAAGKKIVGKAEPEQDPQTPADTEPGDGTGDGTDPSETDPNAPEKTDDKQENTSQEGSDDKQENTDGKTENSAENKG